MKKNKLSVSITLLTSSQIFIIVLFACEDTMTTVTAEDQCTASDPNEITIGSPHSHFTTKKLVFQDEFNGTAIDSTIWSFDTDATGNNAGWGNNELQYYTGQNDGNAYLKDGVLVIEVKYESRGGKNYTSARLHTHGATVAAIKNGVRYGIVEARIKLPASASGAIDDATWPAFWMLGQNFNGWGHTTFGGTTSWPQSGEIDIMESNSREYGYNRILGTAHWYNEEATPAGHAYWGGNSPISNPNTKYYIYTLEWTESYMNFYINYTKYHTHNMQSHQTELKEPFFILLNVAVGGTSTPFIGKNPNSDKYPQYMCVDWVRAYQ